MKKIDRGEAILAVAVLENRGMFSHSKVVLNYLDKEYSMKYQEIDAAIEDNIDLSEYQDSEYLTLAMQVYCKAKPFRWSDWLFASDEEIAATSPDEARIFGFIGKATQAIWCYQIAKFVYHDFNKGLNRK